MVYSRGLIPYFFRFVPKVSKIYLFISVNGDLVIYWPHIKDYEDNS